MPCSKTLCISNRTSETLVLVFCTISTCTCSVCEEWISCERYPIAGWDGATYGVLFVEPRSGRYDSFCSRWDCVGTCFLGQPPSRISRDMLVDFDETADYTLFGGRVDLLFGSGAAVGSGAMSGAFDIGYDVATTVVGSVIENASDGCNVM
ncbi:hypothetical protein ATCC90586_009822 [Pythium insidiosum]|nr:hypothetical protein ATCC90586_009822 [Pythium insidiosum]